MNNKNTYFKRNKEQLEKYAQNSCYRKNGKGKSKECYENNKNRLQEQVLSSYRNLSQDEKDQKGSYEMDRYKNMSKEDNEKVKKYGKRCRKKNTMKKIFLLFLWIV